MTRRTPVLKLATLGAMLAVVLVPTPGSGEGRDQAMAVDRHAKTVLERAIRAANACWGAERPKGGAGAPRPMSYTRPATELLCADGMIGLGDLKTELEKIRDIEDAASVGTLVVRSGGGHSEGFIRLAMLAERYGWLVVIDGACLSSCANYIFLSRADKVVLPNSVVGWHGVPEDPREWERHKAEIPIPPGFAWADVYSWAVHAKQFLVARGFTPELPAVRPKFGHSDAYFAKFQSSAKSGARPFWSYGKKALIDRFKVEGIQYMWEPKTPEEGTDIARRATGADVFFFDLAT